MASNELTHWGIKGQKWGERRYQNEDGTLTEEGKKRYRQNKIVGLYDTVDGTRTENRRLSAEDSVKKYGGVNAAKAEAKATYKKAGIINKLKALGTGALSSGVAGIGALAMSEAGGLASGILGATLAGTGLVGLGVTTVGFAVADYYLRKNKDLAISYIDDVGNRQGTTRNVVNSFSRHS